MKHPEHPEYEIAIDQDRLDIEAIHSYLTQSVRVRLKYSLLCSGYSSGRTLGQPRPLRIALHSSHSLTVRWPVLGSQPHNQVGTSCRPGGQIRFLCGQVPIERQTPD